MSSPGPLADVLFLESCTISQGRTSDWVAARGLQRTVETKEAGGSRSQNAADGILSDWWGGGLTPGNDLIRASCLKRLSWGPASNVELVAELVRRLESRRKRMVTQTESQAVGAGKGEGISRQPGREETPITAVRGQLEEGVEGGGHVSGFGNKGDGGARPGQGHSRSRTQVRGA